MAKKDYLFSQEAGTMKNQQEAAQRLGFDSFASFLRKAAREQLRREEKAFQKRNG